MIWLNCLPARNLHHCSISLSITRISLVAHWKLAECPRILGWDFIGFIVWFQCCFYIMCLYIRGFPDGSDSKETACQCRDVGSIPGLGRSSEEGNGKPLGILAREIPWTEEPGGLQSMGLQRVRHDWACIHTTPHIITKIPLSTPPMPYPPPSSLEKYAF